MCPNMSRQPPIHTQCTPVATSDHPSLSPVQSWPVALSQHAASMRTRGMVIQQPGRCARGRRAEGSRRTDRHSLGWTDPAGWHGPWLELLLCAPGSLAHLGVPPVDLPPPSPSQGRAALSLGQMKEQWIFRGGRKLLCSYPKQKRTSAHIYAVYYIFYELYNIGTYICGDLEGTFLLNDQHFLPPQQQLLAQCISALTCRAGQPSPPSDLPFPP